MKDHVGCAEAITKLDDYLDRQLSVTDVEAIERHLAKCPPCAQGFDFEHAVVQEIRRKVAEVNVPPDLKARVLGRLTQADDCD